MNQADWIAYHSTVRNTIHGLDQLITSMLIQSVGIIGIALSLSQVAPDSGQGLRFWISWALLAIPIAVNFYTILYSGFLGAAVTIAGEIEARTDLADELRLTKSFERGVFAGGRLGPILNVVTGASLGYMTLAVAGFRLYEWSPNAGTTSLASLLLAVPGAVLFFWPILNVASYVRRATAHA
jgi:hypothetical protein